VSIMHGFSIPRHVLFRLGNAAAPRRAHGMFTPPAKLRQSAALEAFRSLPLSREVRACLTPAIRARLRGSRNLLHPHMSSFGAFGEWVKAPISAY